MSEPFLHHLRRQFQAAIPASIDAPAGEEVTERLQAGILRLALGVDYATDTLRGPVAGMLHGLVHYRAAIAAGKDETLLTLWAGELPFFERVDDMGADRNRALTGMGLRPANRALGVGALPHMDGPGLEIDVGPAQATQLGSS